MRIAVTSTPNFGTKFGWRWLRHRCVGPLGLLAMTTVFCHSEASAHTGRGNPSFLRWTGVRAAEVVGPYGKPNQPPKPAGAQRSVRARVGEGWAGIGAKAIPKGGPPPRPPRQRLAKRKARKEELVKFGFCPMTSECSTAHQVRKSQQGPARVHVGTAITE